ncbi:proton-coupled folate transporter isoform X2 [Phymastichus coffea]|uniref:proton-coupled folate transporter isoform X2 n=1 Tax=Phymastichus coffea TaxID=108790 RepID=UPI00273BB7F3|nr:proton-coupled folate transporter isoform X2 [Phymastichus coffea]
MYKKKFIHLIKFISVEPTMWLYMMAYMITSIVEQAFFIQKACSADLGYSELICSNLNRDKNKQIKEKVIVSEFHQWNNIAGHTIPIILAMFIGNWSDRYGRKLPLIIGLIGKFIYSFMIIINSVIPHWSLNMITYTATLPMGLLGGDISIFASCFAYISDVSTTRNRTFRITILDVVYLSAMPTGVAVGSFIFSCFNFAPYTLMFGINSIMVILAIAYSLYKLKWQTSDNQIRISWNSIIFDFFDKNHILETYKTLLKKRQFRGRTYLWIILFCMILYTFQRDEKPISYLYTQLVFNWDVVEFSHFRTFYSGLFVTAMLVTVPIMNKCILLEDSYIVMIGTISHAIGRIAFALAPIWQIFYFGAIIAALGPIAAPALRSIASKIVPVEERGKIFSILSVCDNAVPLASGVMYTQLYQATISTRPNSIFWLTFSTQCGVFFLIMFIKIFLDIKS